MRIANSRLALAIVVGATRGLGRWSARLAAIPGWILWFTPWRVPMSPRALAKQARWLEAATPFSIKTSVGTIAGHSAGDGRPVLLVHGWGEYGANVGAYIDPLVSAGFRAILVDMPGHGRSAGGRTNIIEAARALDEVAAHFGAVYAVVAHSAGAGSALWALHHGLRAERVVLLAPNVDIRNTRIKFASLFRLPPKAMEGLVASIERRFGDDIWDRLDGRTLTQGLSMPALVIHDRDDEQIAYADSEALVASWPSAILRTTAGLGHGRVLRDPEVIGAVVSFLEDGLPDAEAGTAREVTT